MDGVGELAQRTAIRSRGCGVRETPAEYVVRRPKLYLDTSIPSYLRARPSRDPQKARYQHITREWWTLCRWQFDVYWSDQVYEEASKGDQTAARERIETLQLFKEKELLLDRRSEALAEALMKACRLPERARTDANHVAIAATHDLRFLLTWNFAHLANDALRPKMMYICIREGYACPQILTPEEIMRIGAHEQ